MPMENSRSSKSWKRGRGTGSPAGWRGKWLSSAEKRRDANSTRSASGIWLTVRKSSRDVMGCFTGCRGIKECKVNIVKNTERFADNQFDDSVTPCVVVFQITGRWSTVSSSRWLRNVLCTSASVWCHCIWMQLTDSMPLCWKDCEKWQRYSRNIKCMNGKCSIEKWHKVLMQYNTASTDLHYK